MKNEVKQEIAREIADTYYNVIIDGFEEQPHKFIITLLVIEFIEKFRKRNFKLELEDIFTDTIINLMYNETNKYIDI